MQPESEASKYVQIRVTFKITGDELNPKEITSIMNLNPSDSHSKGDKIPKHPDQFYSSGYWGLESSLAISNSLIDHLNYLLEIMASKTKAIKQIKERGFIPCFYCGVFTSDMPETSLLFDSDLLGRIAEMGYQLQIQFYVDSE